MFGRILRYWDTVLKSYRDVTGQSGALDVNIASGEITAASFEQGPGDPDNPWYAQGVNAGVPERLATEDTAALNLSENGLTRTATELAVFRMPAPDRNVFGETVQDSYFAAFGPTANQSLAAPYNPHTFRGKAANGGLVTYFDGTGDIILTTSGVAGDRYYIAHNTQGIAGARSGCRIEHRIRTANSLLLNAVQEYGVTNAAGDAIFTTGARAGFRFANGDLEAFFIQPDLGLNFAFPRLASGSPFDWYDKLDGTGPSGMNITAGSVTPGAIEGTLYTRVQVGSIISFWVNADSAGGPIKVLELGLGGPFPSPVPNPPSIRGYAMVETLVNGSTPTLFVSEVDAEVLERDEFSVVPLNEGPLATTTVPVDATTNVYAIAELRLYTTLGGKPNPYQAHLDELSITTTENAIVTVWLIVNGSLGGYTSGVPFVDEMTFAPPAVGGWNPVQFTGGLALGEARSFAAGTIATPTANAIRLRSAPVFSTRENIINLTDSFDRARFMIGTCGDGSQRSVLITVRNLGNQIATIRVVTARGSGVL